MQLKRKYSKKEDVPEGMEAAYVEQEDGSWDFDGDFGSDPRVDEFRETNKQLHKENQTLKSELGQIRKQLGEYSEIPADFLMQYKNNLAKVEEEKIRKLLEQGNFDAALEAKYGADRKTLKGELEQTLAKNQELLSINERVTRQYAGYKAKTALKKKIGESGLRLRPGADDDLENRLDADWTVDKEGNLTLKRKDLLGDAGGPMNEEEYVGYLLAKKRYFFEEAKGGGGQGKDDEAADTGRKVIARDPESFGNNLEDIAAGTVDVQKRV